MGAKLWQNPFRPPDFVYNNKRPVNVILSFSFRVYEIINRLLKHLVSKNRFHISGPTLTLRQALEFSERKRENLGKVFKPEKSIFTPFSFVQCKTLLLVPCKRDSRYPWGKQHRSLKEMTEFVCESNCKNLIALNSINKRLFPWKL